MLTSQPASSAAVAVTTVEKPFGEIFVNATRLICDCLSSKRALAFLSVRKEEEIDLKPLRETTIPLPASKVTEKRKAEEADTSKDLKKAKLETKALKAKRPGFTDERYNETSYYVENGLRKVYPYYFTFTTFTKGRWVGEKILEVFAREFRAHPAEEYERCIRAGTLTVNYQRVDVDYRLRHNDLLANIVHSANFPTKRSRAHTQTDEGLSAVGSWNTCC
ncbi:hypothetical protein HZH66_010834 [Vespula vulgaris]|uniref:RNA pseudouridylate synthase domain-containing protein 2 n=1 Tax=Vespula vulgaris TaxID=7454 RepID=A0A834MWT7_VESVU|nr:hypothetical protein HZH66_010834 [Vespula vulgaris]